MATVLKVDPGDPIDVIIRKFNKRASATLKKKREKRYYVKKSRKRYLKSKEKKRGKR